MNTKNKQKEHKKLFSPGKKALAEGPSPLQELEVRYTPIQKKT